MAGGETFFVAVRTDAAAQEKVLGFSSHRLLDGEHRTAVYVRGNAARQSVGSALFRAAEAVAVAAGASRVRVSASLGAVEFYKANGFVELGRGQHRLRSGREMACVFMEKHVL